MTVGALRGICHNRVMTAGAVRKVIRVTEPAHARPTSETVLPYREFKQQLLEGPERDYFVLLLRLSGGNMARAAKMADMHRKNLYEKLKQLGIPH